MKNSLVMMAEFFTSGIGIALQISIIVGIALYNWHLFLKKCYSLKAQLQPVVDHLSRIEGMEQFPEEFYELEDTIANSPIMKNPWREFSEVLLRPGEHHLTDSSVIVNTSRPQQFFSDQTIIRPHVNVRYFNSVPNKLTGLGILGTFLGLVAGIYLASSGIGSNNIDEAKGALSHLLDGASLAFLTSIAGLVTSMFFSWKEKKHSYELKHLLNEWNDLLEERLEFISVERLNTCILIEARSQSQALNSFSTDLAVSLGQVLNEQVSQPLNETLGNIQSALEQLNQNQSKAADETIERLISEFSQSISGAAGKEMEAFATTMQSLSGDLREQMKAMNDNHESMQKSTKDTIGDLSKAFTEGSNKMREEISAGVASMVNGVTRSVGEMTSMLKEATQESANNMRKIATEFDSSISKLRDSTNDIADITSNNKALAEEIRLVVASLSEVHLRIAEVVDPIADLAEDLNDCGAALNRGISTLSDSAQTSQQAVTQLKEMQDEVRRYWQSYQDRFSEVDEALGEALESLNQGYATFAESTTSYLSGLDSNAAQIVEKLSGAVRELADVVEDWPATA
ncbi:methyl-accepting chemotaxis protein [Vibrio fluvialis]|uniref:methyl-accepting chemotaxis protein n=1 Tax=Vibrio fluvialis TaxID=676 RepID=UPI00192B580D|nr:methyl-accepting chemotaxis protein [Vibrio fluvialis]MBL4236826.1 methyl-accepting chemotaxis protein [Vibrio fluvialis]MBL4265879.1 methyl-accepting chemotaxis protein [Vibrio fluvialis]MBL4271412.1 methyl-accepting chemotaxis protein [Vibrio fluvialis]MBL4273865.1 methyl-accepting chemotaxis protein [Vibrio fluvialis]MBO1441141.1 methyl-accepting chemotaxis protein [Vibrio fluvialis]